MTAYHYSDEDIAKIKELHEKKLSSSKIARELGKSQTGVSRIIRKGFVNKRKSKNRLTYEIRKQIEEQLSAGKKRTEICKSLNISESTLHNELKISTYSAPYNAEIAHNEALERKKRQYERVSNALSGTENIYSLSKRLENIEQQIEILFDILKGKK